MFAKKKIQSFLSGLHLTILVLKTEKFLNIQFKIKAKPLLIDILLGKNDFPKQNLVRRMVLTFTSTSLLPGLAEDGGAPAPALRPARCDVLCRLTDVKKIWPNAGYTVGQREDLVETHCRGPQTGL